MSDITLLDGGMGQELIRRSGDTPTPLWATQVMVDHPGLVGAIHADYFASGATVATTNSYALHHDRLKGTALEGQLQALCERALAEAGAAVTTHGSGRIAGAIGPLGASYRADLMPPHAEAVALYGELARYLAPGSDMLLVETIPSLAAARAALEACLPEGKPVWLAVTVDDEDGTRLRSGESVADLAAIARDGAAAVLANCSAPEAMPAALDGLARADLPTGAYANAFTQITKAFLAPKPTVDALQARRDMGPAPYAQHVLRWVDAGATLIGGCCETGPDHVAAIRDALRAHGHTIT